MKRLTAAIVIMAVCIGFSVWGEMKIDSSLEEVAYTVNIDSLKGYELWQKQKDFLAVFLQHEDINAVSEEMDAMKEFLENDRTDDAEDSIIRINGYIESIRSNEKLSFSNIF